MSPSGEHAPRTPDRRSSSSALFGAFRSLAAGRLKSPTPPPSASSTTYTPARSSSLAESLQSPVASPADGSLKRLSQHMVPKHARLALGGPPELDRLVDRLATSHPFAERAAAVEAIARILDDYPVENVLELWSRASDMLLPEQPEHVAEQGYRLLRHCAGLPKLDALERNVLFDAASLRKNDGSFDKRLDIIATLTKGGRHVEACESSLAHFVLSSFDACFKQSSDAYRTSRKASDGKKSAEPIREVENLQQLFQYTIDLCKFNSNVFRDDDLDSLLKQVVDRCQKTTQPRDIENAVRLFDTVVTYVHVPKRSLRPCLEVLCATYRQLPGLQDQTWNTLGNLFKSHVGQIAVSALLRTLAEGPVRRTRESSGYRGTIQVLQRLLVENGRNGLPTVPISLLFPALKASIQNAHKTQEEYVIEVVDEIFAQESLKSLLLTELDWTDLLDIISTCTERDDQRSRAQAEKLSGEQVIPTSVASARVSMTNGVTKSPGSSGEGDGEIISNLDLSAPFPPFESVSRHSENRVFKVLCKLDEMSKDLDFVQRDAVMELFMSLAHRLSDSTVENVINYYVDERFLHPSHGNWLEACRSMVSGIVKDSTRPRSLRIIAIKALRDTYNTVQVLCTSDLVSECATLLLDHIDVENDVAVLNELVDFAIDVAQQASFDSFSNIVLLLRRRLQRTTMSPNSGSEMASPTFSTSFHLEADRTLGSLCNVVATAFVRLFIGCVKHSARKTRLLYETLRHVAEVDKYESDARLTVLRLLFRLRADSAHALFVSASSGGESLAAVLCRTEETAGNAEREDNSVADQLRHEDQSPFREQRKTSGSPLPSLSRHTSRYHGANGRVTRPIPPLWMYPGPKGLPVEPLAGVSRVVFTHIDAKHYPLEDDILDMEITLWLEVVISLLQKTSDWEVYSYVVVHLGPQLSNQALVRSCVPQLKMLRSVICEQIRNSSFRDPPSHTLLKKADVAVCLFRILTVLVSYHDYFEKSEEDDLVKAFIHGITNWDRTSKWCIHALSVCCHELPLSVSKSLDTVIQKMSQIVTKPATAIHILDLLTSLARMPELYINFREDEFKMVFGVSFRYLQHIRDKDLREKEQRAITAISPQNGTRSLRHSGPSRELSLSIETGMHKASTKTPKDYLPDYLYSLAYHVIAFWFMGLKMEDRPKLMPWIARSLRFMDERGQAELEEQGQVIVDMMSMVCYSDRDETLGDPNFAKPGDGEVWKKSWIVGHSLVSIETAARTGVSQITTRRPCATRYLFLRPLLAPPPRHQIPLTVGLASETFSSSYIGILPDDIFQTFYASMGSSYDPPIALPDTDMIRRAISTFDRISAVDNYKVGVIYIGDGQTEEKDILLNDSGPPAYTSFISDLGTLCRLKDAKFNTGGLDRQNDTDGEFTYCWRDRCIELVFHVATMMPTDRNSDLTYANKKRHMGNDFVNIIYNDSGLPYDFEHTFPSDFRYVHIVVTPESRASFVDRRLESDPDGKNRYYKVQVMSGPGFPDISPAAETKILAGKHVAAFCRLIAINASVFSSVSSIKDGAPMASSWRNRLSQIKQLRERYGHGEIQTHHAVLPSTVTQQGLSSPPSRENNLASQFKRTSVATLMSDGTNRSSMTSSSHDAAL